MVGKFLGFEKEDENKKFRQGDFEDKFDLNIFLKMRKVGPER